MTSLIEYAVRGGADAVQLSCSMYGAVAVDAAAVQPVSVLASDAAMFGRVADLAPTTVGVLASLESAAADTGQRLTASLATADVATAVATSVVAGAAEAASNGRFEELDRLIVAAALEMAGDVDLLVLAQYSLAPSLDAVQAAVKIPVLSPPHLAASTLAESLSGAAR
jgi:hypothetical protein